MVLLGNAVREVGNRLEEQAAEVNALPEEKEKVRPYMTLPVLQSAVLVLQFDLRT